jgi:Nucleotidyltransferase domain
MGDDDHRLLCRSLSGYLCGTHSGIFARRRGERLDLSSLVALHSRVTRSDSCSPLAHGIWQPGPRHAALCANLRGILAGAPGVIDLIVFGSQARGSATGFSDLDAVLVLQNRIAEEPLALRSLRGRVLTAQRAVLAHQPMQHHGFEVVTPRLLGRAERSLAMPSEAMAESRSLLGASVQASFGNVALADAGARLRALLEPLLEKRAWPRHPWHLHVAVSQFELLPTLFVQARGQATAKHCSFEEARSHFPRHWWAYDVLAEVREKWPQRRRPELEIAARATRNPWLAVDVWRRLPVSAPRRVRALLSQQCLDALRAIAAHMWEGVA